LAAIDAGRSHELIIKKTPSVVFQWQVFTGESDGIWTVKEFKPKPIRFLDDDEGKDWNPPAPFGVDHSDRPIRWQPYPDAKTGEEAYDLSVARAKAEWDSFLAEREAIAERHGEGELERKQEAAHKKNKKLHRALIKLPVTGALAIAVKLATVTEWGTCWQTTEDDLLLSVYDHAVSECGYDPHKDLMNRLDAVSDAMPDAPDEYPLGRQVA
jgi:hypothetical protein